MTDPSDRDDTYDTCRDKINELQEYIKYILKHFGVKEGECFTLPNGDCVGFGCIHDTH